MEYDLCLRLWQEERAQIRHRLRIAVTWSAACLSTAALLCGLLLVAEAAKAPQLPSTGGGVALTGMVLTLLSALGVSVVMVVRKEVDTHHRRAEALFAEFALPADDRARLLQDSRGVYNTADGENALTMPLLAAHLAVFAGGVVAMFAATA